MRVFSFVGFMLAACSPPASTPTEPAPESATVPPASPSAEEDLRASLSAWEKHPDANVRESVRHAAERAMAMPHRTAATDALLGHALANVVLRPDLGLPLLEPIVAGREVDAATTDAWLDAWTRVGDLRRLQTEHQRLRGASLDLDHPAAPVIATQAAADPTIHWTDLRDGVRAARLVEASLAAPRQTFDRPLESIGAAFEAIELLLPGWTITAVAARTRLPTDPLPETPGVRPAADDRRRIVGFGVSPGPEHALRRAGTALDLDRSARNNTIVVEAVSPRGGGLFLTIEGGWRDSALFLHSANDPTRAAAWLAATDALLAGRQNGDDTATIAEAIRARHQAALLTGR